MSLIELAKKSKNILRPFGETDVLLYYGIAAARLKKFLKNKEIAAKNYIPGGKIPYIIKRGSKEKPLFIEDFIEAVTPEFLELRKGHTLKDVESRLNEKQKLVWEYFLPRKLSDFFYATNGEGAGKNIERIFFDLDRGKNMTHEQAQRVAREFVNAIENDKELDKIIEYDLGTFWTGSSFHVFLFLNKPQPNSFYLKYFQYTKENPLGSFTGKWANRVKKIVGFNVSGGHEKMPNVISIDPSQTPSGKLCRAPFSLHMADAKTVDGVDVPIERAMLGDKNLVKKLRAYNPQRVVKELDKLSKRFPKEFI